MRAPRVGVFPFFPSVTEQEIVYPDLPITNLWRLLHVALNRAPYKNRDPSPMSLFPPRSPWEALARDLDLTGYPSSPPPWFSQFAAVRSKLSCC